MESSGVARLLVSIALLGAVATFVAVKHYWGWDMLIGGQDLKFKGLSREMKNTLRGEIENAHRCHHSCATDDDAATPEGRVQCHSKCPRPLEPYVKACHDLPGIKECRATCKGAECERCPKFEVDVLNKMFAANPERTATKAAEKCPSLEKVYTCHKSCVPGDHECHHSCPSMSHGFHHHGWHHHGDHGWHHHGDHEGDEHEHRCEIGERMQEARACHQKCGEDVSCHSKCPKPLAALVKACEHLPVVKKCMATCEDADCKKCATFEVDWLNKKFSEHPEKAVRRAEEKCPMLTEMLTCHQGCKRGDFKCHIQCPSMFPGHGKFEHDGPHAKFEVNGMSPLGVIV